RPLAFSLEVELACDFADIFAVKQYDFALGDPLHARPLPAVGETRFDDEEGVLLASADGYLGHTHVFFSLPVRIEGSRARFDVELDPRQEWSVRMDVLPAPDGDTTRRRAAERQLAQALGSTADAAAAWRLGLPKLEASLSDIDGTYRRSTSDLASLRLTDTDSNGGGLIAAGTPWFMTIFGRDALITSLQTMLLGPDLAGATLHALARLQATEDDPAVDAEPGKIIHEVRRGRAAEVYVPRYYGSIDSTPLFLILLSELWRWTGDGRFVTELRDPALRALQWIDHYGDRDG